MPNLDDQETINTERVAIANEFVEHCGFFRTPNTHFYVLWTKPGADPEKPTATRTKFFSKPNLTSQLWAENNQSYNQVYSTATLKDPKVANKITNCVATPIAWFDIDSGKKFLFNGDTFYEEVKQTILASCYIRSSQQGVQGVFVLDKPVVWEGDKKVWTEKLGNLIADICYRVGGDPAVVTCNRNMRLPGSYNVKPEYKNSYPVSAEWNLDEGSTRTFTVKELEQRFPLDPHVVPLSIWYAIRQAMDKFGFITEEGNRHQFYMALAGSLYYGNWNPVHVGPASKKPRKGGLDKGSVLTLFKMLCKTYGDNDLSDRLRIVEDTYRARNEEEGIQYCGSSNSPYKALQKALEPIMDAWVDLRVWYGKRRNCPIKNFNAEDMSFDDTEQVYYDDEGEVVEAAPQIGSVAPRGNGTFKHEEDGKTYYCGIEGEPTMFSNFQIIPHMTLRKAESNTLIWQCTLKFNRYSKVKSLELEIGASSLSGMSKFRQDLGSKLPPGVACFKNLLWEQYIDWLASILPEKQLDETPHYGIIGIREGTPSIVLPDTPHPTHVWLGQNEDTALPEVHKKEITNSEAVAYLSNFSKYYPGYHEDKYIIPALGFFSASVISECIWVKLMKGFPICLIHGNKGCGKSELIEMVLCTHFGTKKPAAYGPGITLHSVRRHIISNNISPFIVDEFRDGPDDYTKAFKAIMNNLYDQHAMSRGTKEGTIDNSIPKTPLLLIGEHDYDEASTVDRTFKIRINKGWISDYKQRYSTDPAFAKYETERRTWITSNKNEGMMLNIVLRWVEQNFEVVDEIIQQALDLFANTAKYPHPNVSARSEKSIVSIITGILLLRNVFAAYSVKFPWGMQTIMTAIYSASVLEDTGSTDMVVMRMLFQATDNIIVDAARNGRTLQGTVYVFDPENKNIIYFEAKRWLAFLQPALRNSTTAALMKISSFIAMLDDNAGAAGSPVLEVNAEHTVFATNCVKIDLNAVEKSLQINAKQWSRLSAGIEDSGF